MDLETQELLRDFSPSIGRGTDAERITVTVPKSKAFSGSSLPSRTMTLPGPVNPAGKRLETDGNQRTVILPRTDQPALSRD